MNHNFYVHLWSARGFNVFQCFRLLVIEKGLPLKWNSPGWLRVFNSHHRESRFSLAPHRHMYEVIVRRTGMKRPRVFEVFSQGHVCVSKGAVGVLYCSPPQWQLKVLFVGPVLVRVPWKDIALVVHMQNRSVHGCSVRAPG